MGQPDIQPTFDAVSVDGFEQIYQPEPTVAQSAPDQAQTDPTIEAQAVPVPEIEDDPTLGVSLEDAARVLGLHIDTVRKRLQKGKIRGFKIADKFGDKWLVHKDELERPKAVQSIPSTQAQSAPDQAQTDPTIEAQASPEQPRPTHTSQIQPDPEVQRLMSIIEGQAHQLKAAGDVIMYLRSQVDDKDTQLKLLTDSQHKPNWWTRFCSWFVMQR